MQENDLYREFMKGVDVQAATDEFWAGVASTPTALRKSVAQSLQVSRPRTPRFRPGSSIIPSVHRPPVVASDRLLVCNYGAGLLRFTQFCDSINVPESERMPASEVLVAQFAAAHAGSASAKTLNNWLCGLQFWHVINGTLWPSASLLHHTRRGFSKMVPPSSHRAKRPPVTIEALSILFDNLDQTSHLDSAVSAVAMVAFWSCCRLGELVIPSMGLFDPLKHVDRSILPLHISILQNSTRSTSIHIPWTKTTKERGADISITARPHCTCPLAALEHHLFINSSIPIRAPLFSYRDTSLDGWVTLSRPVFIKRCSDVWEAQGFPALLGHAFRIGGATELLLEGVHPDILATQGRWNSRSFLDYWCRIETILPLFLSASFSTQRFIELDSIMDSFAQNHHLPRQATST
ncbi:hypothetical protein DFH29DRAFT_982197 [Suillus ampliporus]|nr:hypothetical protein DFH29DRAFT_982197 [Suillus ampliporus]